MSLADRIQEFLQRLTPLTRNCLLTELERLEMSEAELPGSAELLAKLRAEFRKDGSSQNRGSSASRHFFAPLEPLLVDGAPEHANSGRILRGSLAAIWEWISRDLLPTMARDYIKKIEELVATVDHLKEENRALRQRHESLAGERATLLQKNEQVRTRVEAMIGRLKTLEHGS